MSSAVPRKTNIWGTITQSLTHVKTFFIRWNLEDRVQILFMHGTSVYC